MMKSAERERDEERRAGGGGGGGGGDGDGGIDHLPVFVFPTELVFYSRQNSSHRRVLTLYNPYSYPLHFKMLCTVPSLYSVVDTEGSVRARSCVDIVVRQRDLSQQHWGRRNRFRLDVWGAGGQRGSRELWAELREGEGEEGGQESPHHRAFLHTTPASSTAQWAVSHPERERSPGQFALCVLVGVVCVTVLMLPLHTEPSQVVPSHAHVTLMQKLVCAYVLGLLTVMFLR